MQLLVTGCAGFIGSHLTRRLLSHGHCVVGFDGFDETLYPAAQHRAQLAPLLQHPNFRFTEGDLLTSRQLDALCQGTCGVFHLAALAGVRPSLGQAERYMQVNVVGTQRLLGLCQKHGVRRIVFASSSSVYGAQTRGPFSEEDPATEPVSPYAASKRAAELVCTTHAALYGASIAALRFFTVYGPNQRPDMAIAKFARKMLRGETIELHGDGTSARDYTYIDDIVDGIVAALAYTEREPSGCRAFNLGSKQPVPLLELVSLLEQALGCKANISWTAPQPGDVPMTFAQLDRSFAELHYRPKVSLPEGLLRYAEFLRQNPTVLDPPHDSLAPAP